MSLVVRVVWVVASLLCGSVGRLLDWSPDGGGKEELHVSLSTSWLAEALAKNGSEGIGLLCKADIRDGIRIVDFDRRGLVKKDINLKYCSLCLPREGEVSCGGWFTFLIEKGDSGGVLLMVGNYDNKSVWEQRRFYECRIEANYCIAFAFSWQRSCGSIWWHTPHHQKGCMSIFLVV